MPAFICFGAYFALYGTICSHTRVLVRLMMGPEALQELAAVGVFCACHKAWLQRVVQSHFALDTAPC